MKARSWIQGLLQIGCPADQKGTSLDRLRVTAIDRSTFRIGYVEFRTIDFVEKAIALSGTVVMGLPIMVQLTESERNKLHPGDG